LPTLGGGSRENRHERVEAGHFDRGPGYRLYLTQEGGALIILFSGGTKKRQKADIGRARMLLAEYKARKAAAMPAGKR
jgi:putative addiction module killer protein